MSTNSTSRRPFRGLFGRRTLCRLSGLLTLCWFTVATQALYAQNPVISLTLKDATVREVIEAVKAQSGYSFWYRESEIDLRKRVSVDAREQNVVKLLNGVLADQGIQAKVEGRHIVLYKPEPGRSEAEYQLTGRVETESGDPVVGANVLVDGTTNGMVTNSKGEFILSVTPGAHLNYRLQSRDGGRRQPDTPDSGVEGEYADARRRGGDRVRRAEKGQLDRFDRRASDVGDREPADDPRFAGPLFDAGCLHQPGLGEARQ